MLISAALLSSIGVRAPEPWAGPLSAACAAEGIVTPLRIAAFLANVMLETGMLARLVESLDYPPEALLAQWPQHFTPAAAMALGRTASHPADQQGIAELAYGGRFGNRNPGSGDGWLFRGRGCLQHTFRDNFTVLARAIRWPDAVETLPAWLESEVGACQAATLYWQWHSCNALADQGDIATIRQRINGGTIGLGVVTALYRSILAAVRAQGANAGVAAPALPVRPAVLVQPGSKRLIPVVPAPSSVMSDAAERIVTDSSTSSR